MQGISTGIYHAAILSNCEKSQTAVQEAGRTSGDLTFPIPYAPELHFKEFDSAVADMKNSVMVQILILICCIHFSRRWSKGEEECSIII